MIKMYNTKIRTYHLSATLLAICICTVTVAQNVNYAQYRNSPFYTNPALIGSKSEVSLSVLHRSQQLTDLEKYNTSSVMATIPLVDFKTGRRWGGLGVSIVNDELKGGLAYRMQGVSAAYAYNLSLSKGYYVSFAMQGGYYQRKISMDGLTTSSQWMDNFGLDTNAPLGEALTGVKKNYLSLGSGILFYAEDDNNRQVATLGVAAFNVNKPNASFTKEQDIIPVKITATGSVALLKSKSAMVNAEMLFYHENGKDTYHIGSRASYYFNDDNPFDALQEGSIDFKAGYRVNNAITTEVQFHQPNFSLGLAYDFGIATRESRSNNNGTFEILFTLKKLIRIDKTNKPKTSKPSYATIGEVREFYFGRRDHIKDAQPEDSNQASEGDNKLANNADVSAPSHPNFEFKLQRDFKFGFNEAVLNDEAKKYLDDLVNLLNANKNFMLEIIGHTDNIGTHAANRKMSLKRANLVIDYLANQGIDRTRLRATSMGAKQPIASNNSEEDRAKNRRVEFVIRDLSAK